MIVGRFIMIQRRNPAPSHGKNAHLFLSEVIPSIFSIRRREEK
jgi:hypothetical protein